MIYTHIQFRCYAFIHSFKLSMYVRKTTTTVANKFYMKEKKNYDRMNRLEVNTHTCECV